MSVSTARVFILIVHIKSDHECKQSITVMGHEIWLRSIWYQKTYAKNFYVEKSYGFGREEIHGGENHELYLHSFQKINSPNS